eukprot:SAG11_NODE_768_length_7269_cov_3.840725_9_plen_232_part_00
MPPAPSPPVPPPPIKPQYNCNTTSQSCSKEIGGNYTNHTTCTTNCKPMASHKTLKISGTGTDTLDGVYDLQTSKCNGQSWWGKRGEDATCSQGDCSLDCCTPPTCNCGVGKEGNLSYCFLCGCFACGPQGQCKGFQKRCRSCTCDPSSSCKQSKKCTSGESSITFQANVALSTANGWYLWGPKAGSPSDCGGGDGCFWDFPMTTSVGYPGALGWESNGKSATITWLENLIL